MNIKTIIQFLTLLCVAHAHRKAVKPQSRIIGGARAVVGQFPYAVFLHIMDNQGKYGKCTGSIITEHWVLTAAHCYRGTGSKDDGTRVIASTTDWKKLPPEAQERQSVKYIVHDIVNNRNHFEMDLTLVQIDKPFIFNENVNSIVLAKSPFPNEELVNCISIGFGRKDDVGKIPNTKLNYVNIKGGDFQFCETIKPELKPEGEFLCVDTNKNGSSTCFGDSGGPLICNGLLAGVLSGKAHAGFGQANGRCSGTSAVSVYMFVGFFENWLRKYVPELPEFKSVQTVTEGEKPSFRARKHHRKTAISKLKHRNHNLPFLQDVF